MDLCFFQNCKKKDKCQESSADSFVPQKNYKSHDTCIFFFKTLKNASGKLFMDLCFLQNCKKKDKCQESSADSFVPQKNYKSHDTCLFFQNCKKCKCQTFHGLVLFSKLQKKRQVAGLESLPAGLAEPGRKQVKIAGKN